MKKLKYVFNIYLAFVFANAAFGATCLDGYDIATHNVDLDYNVNTLLPNSVTAVVKSLSANTFILSDDGNCYAGYEPYVRVGADVYPLIEASGLCADGFYRANGTCTAYSSGGCPSGRYNAAIVNTTFVASDDGNCYSGFENYTRPGDDIYPMIDSSILCPNGQYHANGTCTEYVQSTCPDNYYKYNSDDNTFIAQSNGSCASNYGKYTMETNCDVNPAHICADIPTIINLNWYDGDDIVYTNTCRYGTEITLPTEPTRPGYTFSGWRLRQ